MSALNLIIARGFGPEIKELGTVYGDEKNRQQAHNTDVRSAEINQQGAIQGQQYEAQDRARQEQAAQAQAAKFAELSQRVERLYQMDPNSPESQQEIRAITAELALAKGDPSAFQSAMNPQAAQESSGFGNVNPGDYTPESLSRYAQTRDYRDLVRQYAPPGQVLVNTPGFGVGLVDKGNPGNRTMLTTPEQEATARATVAAETAGAKEGAKSAAAAAADLPRVKESSRQIRGLLDQLSNPDALKWVYGPASVAPVIPGTPQADAVGIWDQINGQAFMQAFTSLKGGGQITEKEGEKATVAITRLSNRKISTKAAQAAINELRDITQRAEANAEKRAAQNPSPAQQPAGELHYIPGQGLVRK